MAVPNAVPRLAAPLFLAAAILVSFALEKPQPPIELPAGEAPAPPEAELRAAYERVVSAATPGYDRGVPLARVTVVEFLDFGCRYCASFAAEAYPALADEFVRTGKVRWVTVPFVLGMFPNGEEAARAATCAAEQGRAAFGRMHDVLFARQDEWKGTADAAPLFARYAVDAGLDGARFAACSRAARPAARVRAASELADKMGVRSTPTFFINGGRLEGALPAEQFRRILLDALKQSTTD